MIQSSIWSKCGKIPVIKRTIAHLSKYRVLLTACKLWTSLFVTPPSSILIHSASLTSSKATMVTVSFYEYTCSGDFCGCRCLRNLQYNPGCKYAIMVQVSKWIVYFKSGISLISNHSEYSIVLLKICACDYVSYCCSYYDLVFWAINNIGY